MAIYQLGERIPRIDPTAYVHPEATVIGDVVMHAQSSVWPQVTVRGDTATLTIGRGSNVQDGTVLHADDDCPLVIGDNVTVGHQAMLHGCTIGDGSLVGIQAVILNGAVVGRNCLVGAGALITEGKVFADNMLILGSPARAVRALKPEDIERMQRGNATYVERSSWYKTALKRIDLSEI